MFDEFHFLTEKREAMISSSPCAIFRGLDKGQPPLAGPSPSLEGLSPPQRCR